MDRSRIVLAEIFKPRGLRGELIARSLTDIPGRLESLKKASVQLAGGVDREVELEYAWQHKNDWILKFVGIDTVETANEFRNADLWVPASERALLDGGDYFQSDLIGCQLIDLVSGKSVGVVENFQQYGGHPLMELTIDGHEVLIPFVKSQCQIDLAARIIRLNLPEGILDL